MAEAPDLVRGADGRDRCGWSGRDPLYLRYHDAEWGRPLRDETRLFEMLVLETFQAGLAWITILRKRDAFRDAFRGFDPEAVARFGEADRARLLGDARIVRNRAKIDAAIRNARAFLDLQAAEGAFGDWAWRIAGRTPPAADPRPTRLADVPARTPASEALSRALRERGFRFCGPVVCYAWMQACGLVDDHLAGCFRARDGGESESA
jgi:DNA-3-methyladenine glycosylase I